MTSEIMRQKFSKHKKDLYFHIEHKGIVELKETQFQKCKNVIWQILGKKSINTFKHNYTDAGFRKRSTWNAGSWYLGCCIRRNVTLAFSCLSFNSYQEQVTALKTYSLTKGLYLVQTELYHISDYINITKLIMELKCNTWCYLLS